MPFCDELEKFTMSTDAAAWEEFKKDRSADGMWTVLIEAIQHAT